MPFSRNNPKNNKGSQTNEVKSILRVGAGRQKIDLSDGLFPFEGFCGVHDELFIRVLILEQEIRVAIVSIEITAVFNETVADFREFVGKKAGILPTNILVCATHSFSAPHFWPKEISKNPQEREKNELYGRTLKKALSKATAQALANLQPALMGIGIGCCDVNVNRDVLTQEGWWLGTNETAISDKSLSILRFENLQGKPIALLFSYGVQSSVMSGPATVENSRLITSDLAGAACRFLEEEYEGEVTALFCLGAAADQAPSIKGANFQYVGKDNQPNMIRMGNSGFIISEMLGTRLGVEVLRVSEKIACKKVEIPIVIKNVPIIFDGQEMNHNTRMIRPSTTYIFTPSVDRIESISILIIGEAVLMGLRPELCSKTAMDLSRLSPFPFTMLMTMVNGGAKYMPDESAYDRITYEAMNSPFARGSAERLTAKLLDQLDQISHSLM